MLQGLSEQADDASLATRSGVACAVRFFSALGDQQDLQKSPPLK